MAYRSALDVWRESGAESRKNRDQMKIGERSADMENQLGGNMRPNQPWWERWENFMARQRGDEGVEPC